MAINTYNFWDVDRGNIKVDGAFIMALLTSAATPVALNLPGTSNGVDGLVRYLQWNETDSLLDVNGQTKFTYQPTDDLFGVQVQTAFTGTDAVHNALKATVDFNADGVDGGGVVALSGTAQVADGNTIGEASNLLGIAAMILAGSGGEVDGTGLHAAAYAGIADGGTWTSVDHLAAGWLDIALADAPGTGELEFLYMTNSGGATVGQAIYLDGGDAVGALFNLANVSGMAAETLSASTAAGYITVVVNGATRYINLYSTAPA
ncbi:MAG: hypothetical protein GC190_19385 [Alphaproteobacteria bacterium]|nr:hypothetical protein [Alphaproteobacteria bacterium]